MSDIRPAVRALQQSPAFTIVAVVTIAIGIGANTTLFSVYDRLVLNPVTIPKPSTLVAIWTNSPELNFIAPAVSWPKYEQIHDHARSFASLGISAFDNFTLTGNGDPEQLNGQRVSASFFPTLGILPARGRNFTGDEDQPNGAAVCIISHELWQTRFGGRDRIVGETITLNGQPWEVVGILPPKLSPPYGQVQIFAPRVYDVGGLTPAQIQVGAAYAQPIGRLKPGVLPAQAGIELAALSRSYKEQFSTRLDANATSEPRLFVASLVGTLQPTFYTLIGAVSFVLLIACANVASLFLGRLTAAQGETTIFAALAFVMSVVGLYSVLAYAVSQRTAEIGIRIALGAQSAQVIRMIMRSGLQLVAIGLALGLAAAAGAGRVIQTLLFDVRPLEPMVYAMVAMVFSLIAALACLLPSLRASRIDPLVALRE